jgi:hypothetical protein
VSPFNLAAQGWTSQNPFLVAALNKVSEIGMPSGKLLDLESACILGQFFPEVIFQGINVE